MKFEYRRDDETSVGHAEYLHPAAPISPSRPYPISNVPRLAPSTRAMLWMVAGMALFYGWEMFGVFGTTPSELAGTHKSRIEAALKAAELQQQAKYAVYEKQVELVIRQNDEQWKARMQNVSAYYTAAYDRAKIYAQSTARINEQYQAVRLQTKQRLLAPDIAVSNLSRFWGYGKNYLSPGSGDRAMTYSEELGDYVLNELDKAAKSGTTIVVDGWDTSLPPPQEVQDYLDSFEPSALPPPPDIWTYQKAAGQ